MRGEGGSCHFYLQDVAIADCFCSLFCNKGCVGVMFAFVFVLQFRCEQKNIILRSVLQLQICNFYLLIP